MYRCWPPVLTILYPDKDNLKPSLLKWMVTLVGKSKKYITWRQLKEDRFNIWLSGLAPTRHHGKKLQIWTTVLNFWIHSTVYILISLMPVRLAELNGLKGGGNVTVWTRRYILTASLFWLTKPAADSMAGLSEAWQPHTFSLVPVVRFFSLRSR